MPSLDKKAASVFAGKVVRKDLVRKVKVGANVPVFVLEYLLGKYCATDDPVAIDACQPMGPATVYSPWVVVWLLVYQRLHANATPATAVAELLRSTDTLPPKRRIAERTLSANTGAYSRARKRLNPDIPDAVADRVVPGGGGVPREVPGATGGFLLLGLAARPSTRPGGREVAGNAGGDGGGRQAQAETAQAMPPGYCRSSWRGG